MYAISQRIAKDGLADFREAGKENVGFRGNAADHAGSDYFAGNMDLLRRGKAVRYEGQDRRMAHRGPARLVLFRYQAKAWRKARRVVYKLEMKQGELFPTPMFVVTNRTDDPEDVIRLYGKRGKDGKLHQGIQT